MIQKSIKFQNLDESPAPRKILPKVTFNEVDINIAEIEVAEDKLNKRKTQSYNPQMTGITHEVDP